MSLPSSPPVVAPPVKLVAPLTCATEEGEPYLRRKDIEDKIRGVLERPVSEWPALASRRGAGRLPSEVDAYLITASQALNIDVFGRLVDELGVRMTRIAVHLVQGYDQDTKNEIVWKVEHEVVDAIRLLPPRGAIAAKVFQ